MQSLADGQEMRLSAPGAAPVTSGIFIGNHRVPHRCAISSGIPPRRPKDPSVTQAVLVLHDTPVNEPVSAPVGLAARCTDHRCPFQRSTNGRSNLFVNHPTDLQSVAEAHDTSTSSLLTSA